MIWFILFGIIYIFVTIILMMYFCNDIGGPEGIFMGLATGSLFAVLFVGIASSTIVPMTTGMIENYATGEREGYVTKVSIKGIFWKTNEAEIQVGTGELAALQEPFSFSIDDKELLKELKEAIGKKVRIKYIRWLILPYRKGESNYLLTDVTVLN